jgi:hypothetical protein
VTEVRPRLKHRDREPQIAPTTLSLLGLDRGALEAVVIDGTEGLDTGS